MGLRLRRRQETRLLCDRCMRRADGTGDGWEGHRRRGRLGVYCPSCAPRKRDEYTASEQVEFIELGRGVEGLAAAS